MNATPILIMISYTGIVQKGTARAASLGYPTINIPLTDTSLTGIYAATVKIGEEEFEAAAYADQKRGLLEAHILDFSADLYGWNVTVNLLKKIRERRNFTDDSALATAIAGDIEAVKAYFKQR